MKRLGLSGAFVVLMVALPLVLSCGGGAGSGSDDTTGWSFDNDTSNEVDVTDDGLSGKDMTVPDIIHDVEDAKFEIVFLHDPTAPVYATVNTSVLLAVKVIDYAFMGPAADYPVYFALPEEQQGQEGGGELATYIVYTDEHGIARVTFKAGSIPDEEYTVIAYGDLAVPTQQEVFVTDVPMGDLEIKFENGTGDGSGNTLFTFQNLQVGLIPSMNCDSFHPTHAPVEESDHQNVLPNENKIWTVQNLPVNAHYTVWVTAEGPNGHLAGAGCLDEIVIHADQVNVRTVDINLLVMNPTGCYDLVSEFDFTGAIPGEVGEIINLIVSLFYDPGTFILDMVVEVIQYAVGGIWAEIVDFVLGPFKSTLAGLISDWLLNNSPDWVQCIFIVGQDITQIVARAELIGQLKLSKLQGDYTIRGEENWHGVNINWALGCQQEGPCAVFGASVNPLEGWCEYSPEKDKCVCPIDIVELAGTSFPGDFVSGYFDAHVVPFDKFVILDHTVMINYGKLILFVINDLIIYYVTGGEYSSIEDALKSFINCHSIAHDSALGDLLDSIPGVEANDIESWCDGAVNFLVSPIEEIIGSLQFDSKLHLHGGARLLDTDNDLAVDELIEGYWFGTIEIDGAGGPEFDGSFEASRAAVCQ